MKVRRGSGKKSKKEKNNKTSKPLAVFALLALFATNGFLDYFLHLENVS